MRSVSLSNLLQDLLRTGPTSTLEKIGAKKVEW